MKLDDLRAQIDAIDNQLLSLLEARMDIVEQVGALKRSEGCKGAFIRPKREDEMMRDILAKGAGKFPKEGLFAIWRAIISASLQLENPFRVVTVSPVDKKIYEYFGAFTEYLVLATPEEVFSHLKSQDVGVVPKTVDLAQIPAGMVVFAEIGENKAIANIKDDQC